jgi:hypothetical protein
MNAVVDQRKLESEALVANIATAIGISFSQEALTAWQSSHGSSGPDAGAVAAYKGTVGRIASMFPGAVRVRSN